LVELHSTSTSVLLDFVYFNRHKHISSGNCTEHAHPDRKDNTSKRWNNIYWTTRILL